MKRRNLGGQIAVNFGIGAYWSIENFWINMFWSREISPELGYISAMVSISAIVAVFTMIVFGARSDSSKNRFGRRKYFILLGGVFGGISMFFFPLTKQINLSYGLAAAIVFGVFIDILITFFGDWTTPTRLALFNEHTKPEERGKISALISIGGGLGGAIVMGMYILDIFNNSVFFYVGGVVMIIGCVTSYFLFDDPPEPNNERQFKECLTQILKRESYSKNKSFYLLLFAIAVLFFGTNFYSNYINVYAENVLLYTPAQVGIISVLSVVLGLFTTLPASFLSDKVGRKKPIMICLSLFIVAICFLPLFEHKSYWFIAIDFALIASLSSSVDIVAGAWLNDLTPKDMKGSLLAYLMVVRVIPMTPGSIFGAIIGEGLAPAGVEYSILMFVFGGIIAFLSIGLFRKVRETIKPITPKLETTHLD